VSDLSPKENYLAAIRFANPERVPLGNEPIFHGFQFEGNFYMGNWTDLWGVRWEAGLEYTVPFPKGNPLPSFDRLHEYRFPSPDALVFSDELLQTRLSSAMNCGRVSPGWTAELGSSSEI